MISFQLNLFQEIVIPSERWVISAKTKPWDEVSKEFRDRSMLTVKMFLSQEDAEKYYKKFVRKYLRYKYVNTLHGRRKLTELVRFRLATEHELKLYEIQKRGLDEN